MSRRRIGLRIRAIKFARQFEHQVNCEIFRQRKRLPWEYDYNSKALATGLLKIFISLRSSILLIRRNFIHYFVNYFEQSYRSSFSKFIDFWYTMNICSVESNSHKKIHVLISFCTMFVSRKINRRRNEWLNETSHKGKIRFAIFRSRANRTYRIIHATFIHTHNIAYICSISKYTYASWRIIDRVFLFVFLQYVYV